MTVVLGQQFLQGVIVMADCRASWIDKGNGKVVAKRDITQKIFFLNDNLIIGFAGDIDTAGAIICFLSREIGLRQKLGNLHIFTENAQRLIKFAYAEYCKQKGKQETVEFVIAGVDKGRPERVVDAEGKTTGYMPFYDRKVIKLRSPDFIRQDTSVIQDPIAIIGSGAEAFTDELKEEFKKLQFSFALAGPLAYSAVIIGDVLMKKIRELGIDTVGGMTQIAVVENEGSGFVPYQGRSEGNTGPNSKLDIEMYIRDDGRLVQRNLVTKEEIPLLHPLEVVEIKEVSNQLFADLNRL
jgi:hypothetical protein